MPLLLWWHCAIRILFIFVFCRVCAQRPDTVVYDEPLYAHFLRTHKEEQTWRPYSTAMRCSNSRYDDMLDLWNDADISRPM